MSSPSPSPDRARINLVWLLRLRWGVLLGQGALVLFAPWATGVTLPTAVLLGLIGFGLVVSAGLHLWQRRAARITDRPILGVMLFDAALLTALLALSGGPFNPFSTLYLVNVALAAVLLSPRASAVQLGVSLAAFGSLFLLQKLPAPGGLTLPSHLEMMQLHLGGMWIAFALAALFIVYFVQRVTRALAQREQELEQARQQSLRREKLASLTTLAAGAAHELSTPLSTIAVVMDELERTFARSGMSAEAADDLRLVQAQLERCRTILRRMAADAGQVTGESLARLRVGDWTRAALEGVSAAEGRVAVEASAGVQEARVEGPPSALASTLRGLIKNALQASGDAQEVRVRLSREDARVRVEVTDQGEGMSPETLARAGEPFFTTRAPGEGMGLGLFLTRVLMEQLGGGFDLRSAPARGTTAVLWLPTVEAAP